MEGKEWFEKSKYVYSLDEHDEGGYLGIDENKVAEMLDEYYQYKLKLLGISGVVSSLPTKEQTLSDLLEFMNRIPDDNVIRDNAMEMDEKEFESWWWETIYKEK